MSDNEIVKFFEELLEDKKFGYQYFLGQGHYPDEKMERDIVYTQNLLDFTKHRKAEIDRLQSMNQAKLDMIHDLQAEIGKLENDLAISKKETKRYAAQCQTIRSETAKELAERLEETAMGKLAWDAYDEEICGFVTVDEIDNLVKEFMKKEVEK